VARRHTMTPARRAALRKAQLASARKRKGRGRSVAYRASYAKTRAVGHVRRNRKRYVAGVAVIGASAAGYSAYDHTVNVRLYHNTANANLRHIKAQGLHGVKVGSYSHRNFREPVGQVFVSKGLNTSKHFGPGTVRIKMNRKEFNKHATKDRHMQTRQAFKIHESHLYGKKVRTRRGGPLRKAFHLAYFPDGTKESYGKGRMG
jgi:hypothetical protein